MKAVMSNVLNAEEEEEDAVEEDDVPSSMLEKFFLARVYTNSNAHAHIQTPEERQTSLPVSND